MAERRPCTYNSDTGECDGSCRYCTGFKAIAKEINERFPMGTFDDDPGGPWLAPGIPCHCANGRPDKCPGKSCPHHITNRPGWKG